MRPRPDYELPAERRRDLRRAIRLEWATLGFMSTIVAVIYLAMGSSQAMKAAWIEDLLSFVPAIAFLVSTRVRERSANREFPYGFHRSVSIAFLAGSVALTLFGGYILIDSLIGLARTERPSLGLSVVGGVELWSGWTMIAALTYSAIPPMVLGRMKLPLARRLHDKTLKADSDMNRADWMTAGAGIVGILGVGAGWWWADSAAGAVISLNIVNDGVQNLGRVVKDLMDQRPTTVEGETSSIVQDVHAALLALPWVAAAEVRLREEGHVFAGELFVRPGDGRLDAGRVAEAAEIARGIDWRVHDVVVTLLPADGGEG